MKDRSISTNLIYQNNKVNNNNINNFGIGVFQIDSNLRYSKFMGSKQIQERNIIQQKGLRISKNSINSITEKYNSLKKPYNNQVLQNNQGSLVPKVDLTKLDRFETNYTPRSTNTLQSPHYFTNQFSQNQQYQQFQPNTQPLNSRQPSTQYINYQRDIQNQQFTQFTHRKQENADLEETVKHYNHQLPSNFFKQKVTSHTCRSPIRRSQSLHFVQPQGFLQTQPDIQSKIYPTVQPFNIYPINENIQQEQQQEKQYAQPYIPKSISQYLNKPQTYRASIRKSQSLHFAQPQGFLQTQPDLQSNHQQSYLTSQKNKMIHRISPKKQLFRIYPNNENIYQQEKKYAQPYVPKSVSQYINNDVYIQYNPPVTTKFSPSLNNTASFTPKNNHQNYENKQSPLIQNQFIHQQQNHIYPYNNNIQQQQQQQQQNQNKDQESFYQNYNTQQKLQNDQRQRTKSNIVYNNNIPQYQFQPQQQHQLQPIQQQSIQIDVQHNQPLNDDYYSPIQKLISQEYQVQQDSLYIQPDNFLTPIQPDNLLAPIQPDNFIEPIKPNNQSSIQSIIPDNYQTPQQHNNQYTDLLSSNLCLFKSPEQQNIQLEDANQQFDFSPLKQMNPLQTNFFDKCIHVQSQIIDSDFKSDFKVNSEQVISKLQLYTEEENLAYQLTKSNDISILSDNLQIRSSKMQFTKDLQFIQVDQNLYNIPQILQKGTYYQSMSFDGMVIFIENICVKIKNPDLMKAMKIFHNIYNIKHHDLEENA